MKLSDKLKSRKLWLGLIGSVLPFIGALFGFDGEAIYAGLSAIIAAIAGQSYVDGQAIKAQSALDLALAEPPKIGQSSVTLHPGHAEKPVTIGERTWLSSRRNPDEKE